MVADRIFRETGQLSICFVMVNNYCSNYQSHIYVPILITFPKGTEMIEMQPLPSLSRTE